MITVAVMHSVTIFSICRNSVAYETVVRLDARIKHHVINMIAKELTDLSGQKVNASTQLLRSIAGHRSAIDH